MNLNQPIKIILLYENYYKSEALSELYRLHPDLVNDGRLWLVTIKELEMLMMLYSKSPQKAKEVFEMKNNAELTNDNNGRELLKFLSNEDVGSNEYLYKFGIHKQFDEVLKILGENEVGDKLVDRKYS